MAAPVGLSAAGPRRPDAVSRLSREVRVFIRRGTLDGLIAAGADPSWDPDLELRARQISAPRRRRALARGLEHAVREASRPPRWTCKAPLNRRAVRSAAPELTALALDLTVEASPAAQGVALATQLLCDPDSPLYAPAGETVLGSAAVVARQALR
jgi:hypothetical protein